ncbi:carboxypeptidase-like regulatory domain-containing protein [Tamlana fucoidanivorans]|uniref:Alpha-2-macroglobulin n=1 Tax=Allotamlana fucoidanivorans TaxID=2583814 RepID=A0A5C4SJQ2_9FLAO|nr:carboxypeptidase-like regulatory domain-containing protein [Tamlana fucoidanivorans]TNJ43781.1 alpha-2-macroglobulin [Tamlana fucoidanivorans]
MKHWLITSALLFLSLFIHAQNDTYQNLWSQVEQYELDGLVQSALKTVTSIENQALKDNNHVQVIKTMLYKSKFALVLEEDAQLQIIENFKQNISNSTFPTKHILENILANLYWQYFNQNRWRFYNRSTTSEKVDVQDFRTWDLQTLFNEIHLHYQNSLKNGLLLQQEQLEKYAILLNEYPDSKVFRPTLFDFLCHQALEFYKTDETHISKPAYKFELNNPEFMANAQPFSTLKIQSKDSTSLQLQALKIYKSLIRFHLDDSSKLALADVNIDRLSFVQQHATFPEKETVLLETLQQESQALQDKEASALYDFKIASLYYSQSQNYEPKTKEDYRWKAKEALKICHDIISKYPESLSAEKCSVLKSQILQASFEITTEQFLPIQKHARVLVKYKNTDTLHFKVYKLSENQVKQFNKIYRKEEQQRFTEKLHLYKSWQSTLKNETDFQTHTTEVLLPKLNNGRYLIVASNKNLENSFAFAQVQVTNLALIETETPNQKIFQIIDRNHGKPISNARIDFSYFSRKIGNNKTEFYTTDDNGQIKIRKDNSWYNNIHLKVKKEGDIAYFGNYYINRFYKTDKEDVNYRAFLFTDRSIYRPGQTVFFKAIAMKTKDGKSEVIPNELFHLEVYDVNEDDVFNIALTTNEFGSISGEFVLPNSGLNGEYTIELYSDSNRIDIDNTFHFSVEEYKRPKFETKFNPVTKTYKVNDSIKVNGKALAYAGSNVTNSKVTYRVHRKIEYPRWYFWYYPSASHEAQEITHGETTTNDSGNFEITFKAIPDKSAHPSSLPVFKYEVIADVTDLNGETRSTTTIINVGYHALIAQLSVPEQLDKTNKHHEIHISTQNLNGEFAPTKGTIKIYKAKSPNRVLRKRPWPTPDYQEFSEEAYTHLFPHDAYNNAYNLTSLEKGTLVLEKTFDTKLSKTLEFGRIKHWKSGQYIIILEAKDKFGQLVKDESRTVLFSNNDLLPADNQLFTISTDKPSYQVGETAHITLGSAAKHLNITILIEKKDQEIQTEIITLNANKKVISIPVTAIDLGGFAINYSFAAFNNYNSGTQFIAVPFPKTNLSIETLIFRDKLQPGTDEAWQFKIKGPDGNQVSAELLASMYDASLDQFKPHTWNFSPINTPTYRAQHRYSGYRSFGTTYFRTHNNYQYFNYPEQHYDTYNWFGFSFTNNQWVNNQYLQSLKYRRSMQFHENVKDGFISGTISDKNGNPIPGATIVVKGTSQGVTTDFDGNFAIQAQQGDVLEISFIGYTTQNITVSKNRLNISLSEDEAHLDEVVVVGYGTQKKEAITGAVAMVQEETLEDSLSLQNALAGQISGLEIDSEPGVPGAPSKIMIRGASSVPNNGKPLYIIDGKIVEGNMDLDPSNIQSINVLKDASATAIYGSKAANGVILITTKSSLNTLSQVQIRKNLNETAFFLPHLQTDEQGNISFSFTTPEALTQWKLQLLAHTKHLKSKVTRLTAVTQKELMILPNTPRFLRAGDSIRLSAKVANLTEQPISGTARLLLFDAISGQPIDIDLKNIENQKSFSINAKGNTHVSWNISIPESIQAVQYKFIAQSNNFSDGEENVLPVLSNRILVTETLPMWVKSNETRTFTLDKLKTNHSASLKHHKFTLEITSNPAWYAVQALPYLMEYPYECNEQTFSRFYANTLARYIVNSNPKIKTVFDQWGSQDALISNLEKNQELKSILVQETPWLRDAQSETEQKKRIALLFDLHKMNTAQQIAITKLKSNQMASGGWSWFNGGRENRYITQHIISGFGHLKQLVITDNDQYSMMIKKALSYLDKQFVKAYHDIKKYNSHVDLSKDHLTHSQLQYLYMRSFFPEIKKSKEVERIMNYYQTQIKTYWLKRNLSSKGMMALITYRNNDWDTAKKIMKALQETSITSEELGMYWKENTNSWFWYEAPIETQALMIEMFTEAGSLIFNKEEQQETIDNLKIWLLKNKQTNQWKTTKATTEAVYALLLQGSDWLSVTEAVNVSVGDKKIAPKALDGVNIEAGTGYYKTFWAASEIQPNMAKITLAKKGEGIAWGNAYWQYFEDLDKVTSAKTPLQLKKNLFLKRNTDTGEIISKITPETPLQVGDLIRVRIELKSDRNMEFLHMKDMRAAGLEPVNIISDYKWQDGLGYYQSTKDASTNFFFDHLPKGVYVFEYDLRVNNAGHMSNGITTIQSMYAPEFSSHSEGKRIHISE